MGILRHTAVPGLSWTSVFPQLRIASIVHLLSAVALTLTSGIAGGSQPNSDNSGPMIDCAQISAPSSGAKLESCLAQLTAGSVADARSLAGKIDISHSIALDKAGVTILLPARSAITLEDGVSLAIAASSIRIKGMGQSTVVGLGSGSAIRIGRDGAPVWGWELSRMAIQPAAGKHTATAIYLASAREGFLEKVKVSGFAGPAIDVADDCWSNRVIESRVIQNDIGFNFRGSNLNAWNIRGGQINSNRIALNFDLGDGKLQGVSITDGTQLEDNKLAAVRLESGVILGLFFSDIYCELFNTERLIMAEPSGKALHADLVSVVNAYVFSEDTPPVSVKTRAADNANVTISHLLVRHSRQQMPIAEASGTNTSVEVSESASTSAANEFSSTLITANGGARATTR